MVWKVYNIESGKTLKAGFDSEDEAKEWLELKGADLQDHYEVEEMDFDEEEEWLEAQEADALEDEEEVEPEEAEVEDEAVPVTYGDEYYDGADLADDEDKLSVIDDDEMS